MNSSCLPHSKPWVSKNKSRKKEKEMCTWSESQQVSKRMPTPLCRYLQCVWLVTSWRKSMQLEHSPEKRLTSVFGTLENQLETLYKSLLVLQLIQQCSWDRWFTVAAPTSPCSAHWGSRLRSGLGGITEEWGTPTKGSNHETQRTTGAEVILKVMITTFKI